MNQTIDYRQTRTGEVLQTSFTPPRWGLRTVLCIVVAMTSTFLSQDALFGQDPAEVFEQSCKGCHNIGGGHKVGPDLKDVTKREGVDRTWLAEFIENPDSKLKDKGDAYAQKILKESRGVPMTKRPEGMSIALANKLLDFIDAESNLPDGSQFKGVVVDMEPFSKEDVTHGEELFTGLKSFKNKGPACLSCHSMQGLSALGGGRLGPDLTNHFKDRVSLSGWLGAPTSKTMQPIFKKDMTSTDGETFPYDKSLTEEEIRALVAYFESTAGNSPSEPTVNRVALILLSLAFAAVLLSALDAIWKRRFHSVRRTMVDTPDAGGSS